MSLITISKENVASFENVSFMYSFFQWLKYLTFKNIRLHGTVVRSWILPCYLQNLNPYQFESVLKILETQPQIYMSNDIDLWCQTEEQFQQLIHEVQSLGKLLGFQTKTSKTYVQNNIHLKKVYFDSEIISRQQFEINFYGTPTFENVDFDVNNLFVECSTVHGIERLDIIHVRGVPEIPEGFGYLTVKRQLFQQSIESIIQKKARFLPKTTLNKIQMIRKTEKIFEAGFQIENHPALKPVVVNPLQIFQCSICLESLETLESLESVDQTVHSRNNCVETRCSHVFHQACLFKWWTEHFPMSWFLQCPNCRNLYNLSKT